jgi:hypothetical protein
MILDDKVLRNDLRNILQSAAEKGFLTEAEGRFTDQLFEKIDLEVARKTKDLNRLEGSIHQLRLTKGLIINMIKESIAAAERAKAREETMDRIRSGKAARETLVIETEPEEEETKTTKKKSTRKKRETKDK